MLGESDIMQEFLASPEVDSVSIFGTLYYWTILKFMKKGFVHYIVPFSLGKVHPSSSFK